MYITLIFLVLLTPIIAFGKGQELSEQFESLNDKIINFWEYPPDDFYNEINLTVGSRKKLHDFLLVNKNFSFPGLQLIAANNCLDMSYDNQLEKLYLYRCHDLNYSTFLATAVDKPILFLFSKDSDLTTSIAYLVEYQKIFSGKEKKFKIDSEYLEFISEIEIRLIRKSTVVK